MMLLLGALLSLIAAAMAFSTPASSSSSSSTPSSSSSSENDDYRSPWAPAEWRLDLNIGREPGTWMPEDWASSGARLGFSVDCRIESSDVPADQQELDWTAGRTSRLVTVLQDPTYITADGEQVLYIPEQGGGWTMQLPRKKGQAGTLRIWLDLEEASDDDDDDDDDASGLAAQKNDVTLDAADRLYLSAKCWREKDYEIGRRRMIPIQEAAQAAQDRVDAQLSHETGDRRLDGTNPVDTIKASIDMAVLVKERDECVQALREAELILPSNDGKPGFFGFWPGSTEGLVVSTGTVTVKRKKLFREEFHVVGTWKAIPVLRRED